MSEWQGLRLTTDNLHGHFGSGVTGVGVLNGEPSGGLVDVDLDCPEAIQAAPIFLPATACIFGRPSKPRSHYVYRVEQEPAYWKITDADADKTTLVELRTTGQTVWPPSRHPEGESVRFDEDGEPALVEASVLCEAVARLGACVLLARRWPKVPGSRHDIANAAAGLLLRGGLDRDLVATLIETAAAIAGDEEARERGRTARATADTLASDQHATGGPTLAGLIGEETVAKLCDVLGFSSRRAGTGNASRTAYGRKVPSLSFSRVPLTGAQSFVDGVLIYAFRAADGIICVTSAGEVLDEDEAAKRYDLPRPDVAPRLSDDALERFSAGEPPPDGRQLFEDLVALLRRHVAWPSEETPALVALWIMHTYLVRIFTYCPYLVLTSPTRRCGKSLVEEVCSELAFNATPPQANPTAPNIFRDIHENASTVILDEVESLGGSNGDNRAELRAMLNVGFKYDGTVPRMERRGDAWERVRYRAFGPKVFASIRPLPDTLRDRSLIIPLRRKRRDERVTRFNVRKLKSLLAELRDRLHLWALGHARAVAELYESEALDLPAALDDRARDILEPLFALAGVIDAENDGRPDVTEALEQAVVELMDKRTDDDGDRTVMLAVEALRDRFRDEPTDSILLRSDEAVPVFANGGLTWVTEAKHARSLLKRLGFTSGSHRPGPRQATVRAYRITREAVDDLAARYLPLAESESRAEESTAA
jgi:hypothetical protein